MRNHAYQESIHIPLKQIIRKTRLYLKWHKRNRNINYIKRYKQRRDTNQKGISASADKLQIFKGLAHQRRSASSIRMIRQYSVSQAAISKTPSFVRTP